MISGNALIRRDDQQREAIIQAVLNTLTSRHSQRAYRRALADFMTWYKEVGRGRLDKATVNAYLQYLLDQDVTASSINQRLSAIRALAREAADAQVISDELARSIGNIKGIRQQGQRLGNWLTLEQAQALLRTPRPGTLKGARDRAILALLLGCGLRREEVALLEVRHFQMRDNRWVILDMVGKGGRVRTIPMPTWAKEALDAWQAHASITSGHVFRAVNRGGRVYGAGMTSQAVYNVLKDYAAELDLDIAPHDLRRSFAKLARAGGSPIEQIQLSLGHASVQTTERYLGSEQSLTDAPCDHLGLKL